MTGIIFFFLGLVIGGTATVVYFSFTGSVLNWVKK